MSIEWDEQLTRVQAQNDQFFAEMRDTPELAIVFDAIAEAVLAFAQVLYSAGVPGPYIVSSTTSMAAQAVDAIRGVSDL